MYVQKWYAVLNGVSSGPSVQLLVMQDPDNLKTIFGVTLFKGLEFPKRYGLHMLLLIPIHNFQL